MLFLKSEHINTVHFNEDEHNLKWISGLFIFVDRARKKIWPFSLRGVTFTAQNLLSPWQSNANFVTVSKRQFSRERSETLNTYSQYSCLITQQVLHFSRLYSQRYRRTKSGLFFSADFSSPSPEAQWSISGIIPIAMKRSKQIIWYFVFINLNI